jgi:hypothetical protein
MVKWEDPKPSLLVNSLRGHVARAFEWVHALATWALHLTVHRALMVYWSHYMAIDLGALIEGYVNTPDAVLDTIDEEVQVPMTSHMAFFVEEIVSPLCEL